MSQLLTTITHQELTARITSHAVWVGSEGKDGERADLSYLNLEGQDLSEVMLIRAHLKGTCLKGANLYGANLYEADLTEANLEGANLQCADLEESTLSRTLLTGADLRGTYLRGSNIYNAQYKHLIR